MLPQLPSRAGAALFVAALALAAPLSAQTITYGFDDVSAPPSFGQIPPGFGNGPVLDKQGAVYSGGVILDDLLFDNAATTPGNILGTCDGCLLGDFETTLPGTITIRFDAPVDEVDLDVINGFGGGGGDFTLTLFGPGGVPLAAETVTTGPAGTPSALGHLGTRAPGATVARVTSSHGQGLTWAIDTVVFRAYESLFVDLGAALAGSAGTPALSAFGSLLRDEPLDIDLVAGPPLGSAVPVVGASVLNAPFKQGVMVPSPDVILPALPLDGEGELHASFTFPAGVPDGFTLYLQLWLPNAGGPAGFAASNALAATTPG